MLKRCFSNFLVIMIIATMVISCMPGVVSMAAAGELRKIVLADFNGGSFKRVDRNPLAWLKLTDDVAFEDGAKTKSLEWTMDNNNFNIYAGGYGIDKISANKTVNIRFKADEGTRFNLVYQKERNASGTNTKKYLVTADGTWQTYSVDFENIKSLYNDESFSVKFDCSGWGFANNETENYYIPGSKLYVDSIWVECTSESRNEKLLFDFNRKMAPAAVSAMGNGTFEVSSDADEGCANSLKYILLGDGNDLKLACPENADWTLYDTVVFRLKADKLENSERTYQKLNFVFSGPAVFEGGSTYKKLDAKVAVDTWQDIEFNVSDLSTALAAGSNSCSIGLIRLNVGGWSNTDYESGATIYLDSIALKQSGDFSGNQTVLDFNDVTGYGEVYTKDKCHTLKSTENPYPSKVQNIKWNIVKDDITLRIKLASALELNDYENVAFRVYSTAEQIVGFMFSNATSVGGSNLYFRKAITVPAGEWTVIKVAKSDIQSGSIGTSDINYIQLNVGGWSTDAVVDSNIYIDSVWLEKAALEAPLCEFDGVEGVKPYLDGYNTLSFEFAENLYPYNYYDAVTVEENGVALSFGYWVSHTDNKLNVIFENALKNNTTYTVKLARDYICTMTGEYLPESFVSFKTAEAYTTWSNAEFEVESIPESGELRAVVSSSNTSAVSEKAELIIAVYSDDKTLETVITADATALAYQDCVSYATVADVTAYTGCTYKVFLWNSTDELVPLCKADVLY